MNLSTTTARIILATFVIVAIGGCLNNPKSYRFLIPRDFVGRVYVYFNVPGAEPLQTEDGYQLIIIPNSGIYHTSSAPLMGGEFHSEHWLYFGNERTKMSPYKIGGGGSVNRKNSNGKQELFIHFEVLKEERLHETI